MKADIRKDITLILELNVEEAQWLQELMRNPLPAGIDIKNENEIDCIMRSKFFQTISNYAINWMPASPYHQ